MVVGFRPEACVYESLRMRRMRGVTKNMPAMLDGRIVDAKVDRGATREAFMLVVRPRWPV